MVKEIKLKVSMHSEKCRKEVFKIVTKLSRINKVSVDLNKEILVVIGDVDPICVATCLRKKRKTADIVSVKPYKKENENTKIRFPIMCYDNTHYYGGYGHAVGYPPSRDGGGCNVL